MNPIEPISKYAKAKLGPRDDYIGSIRLAICAECPHQEVTPEGKRYCKKCGCPKWRDSELTRKASMVKATCPEGKWPR